jgi:phenylpropionate dioxygenase-like ring-hydroxylating dioxygenase large terminal subunit
MPTSTVNIDRTQLTKLQQQILATAQRPLEQAIALPAQVYTDPDFYQWEVQHILKKQWLCVGHISQVAQPGDYVNLELLEEPLTIVRGSDDQVRVLSRVCPHRGMDIMPAGFGHPDQGNRRSFLCPYHHWSYRLDGSLMGAPEMAQSQQFERDQLGLATVRSEIWQGFIFVTFDPTLESVSTLYAPLLPYVERWQMADLSMVANLKWDCQFNWKVLVENFIEAYHHLGTHHKTFEPMMPAAGTWTKSTSTHSLVCHLPLTKALVERIKAGQPPLIFHPPAALLPSDYEEYTVYLGAPNFLLFNGPDRVYWYLLLPNNAGQMTLHTTLLVTPESQDLPNFETLLQQEIAGLREFHLEDVEVCTAVQRGLHSAVYQPGPLGHLEMPIWLFQQYLAQQIEASDR